MLLPNNVIKRYQIPHLMMMMMVIMIMMIIITIIIIIIIIINRTLMPCSVSS